MDEYELVSTDRGRTAVLYVGTERNVWHQYDRMTADAVDPSRYSVRPAPDTPPVRADGTHVDHRETYRGYSIETGYSVLGVWSYLVVLDLGTLAHVTLGGARANIDAMTAEVTR